MTYRLRALTMRPGLDQSPTSSLESPRGDDNYAQAEDQVSPHLPCSPDQARLSARV